MIDKLIHFEVGDKKYPLAFNLNVIEMIQEEYEDLNEWQEYLSPSDDKLPNIKVLKQTFTWFINEGIDIENDDLEVKRPFLTHKQVGRLLSQLGTDNALKNIFETVSSGLVEDEDTDPNTKSQAIQE